MESLYVRLVRTLTRSMSPRNVLLAAFVVAGTLGAIIYTRYLRMRAADVWEIGELRGDGLRIVPSGSGNASAVLDPRQFADEETRHAYWIATKIPDVLNRLYCWCGCENSGQHRSNLACFEDLMGVDCEVCQGSAEIAYTMVGRGIRDAATIQSAVDAKWGP